MINLAKFSCKLYIILNKMGCMSSSAIHTSTCLFQLKQQLKQMYRDIISKDDILQLVQLESTNNSPPNIQLSQPSLLWTPIHYCCRFDSPCCLDYFLKKSYIHHVNQYIDYVNRQTQEGLNSLQLCAMWAANKCFALLVAYGGLNLASANKLNKTVFDIAKDYGNKQIEEILVLLKKREGVVTNWNHRLLGESPDIKSMKNHSYYDQILQKIRTHANQQGTNISTDQSNEQKQLQQLKAKLEAQKEHLYEQMRMKMVSISVQKQLFTPQNGQNEDILNQQQDKQEIQSVIKSKQEQIEALKDKIHKLHKQQINTLLQNQKNKINLDNEEQMQNYKEIVAKFQLFNSNILQQPHKLNQLTQDQQVKTFNKSRIRDSSLSNSKHSLLQQKILASEDMKYFKLLPQKIQKRYYEAKQKGHFEDDEFIHSEASLGGIQYEDRIKLFRNSLIWLRPTQFLNPIFQLFDGIDPNDVKQGQLSVCYCLATISQYARKPENILNIFIFYDLKIGFYVLKFYTNGKVNYVVVDDYFPCNSISKQPLFSKPIGNEIWVLLIEKTWAKVIGGYFSAQLMTPDFFMQDLTGNPTFGTFLKNNPNKIKELVEYSSKNFSIVLTSSQNKIQGIVCNHAYSLLKVIENQGSFIYRLRNPWGRFEWNGCYGERSALWTPELKIKCQYVEGDDGIFFLSQSEVLQAFSYYSVALDESEAKYSFLEFSSKPTENVYFKFTLNKKQKMAIRITQIFKRLLKDKDYKYSSVIFELGKISQDKVEFLSEGNDRCYFGEKSVYVNNDIYKQYEAGEYFIRVKIQWKYPQKYNSATLSIYCHQLVKIQRLQDQQGLILWKRLLYGFVQRKKMTPLNQDVSYSMEWMRAQMVCYSTLIESARKDSYKVKWTFKADLLDNCRLHLGRINDSTIEQIVDRSNSFVIGTVDRIDISKSCHSGNVSIQALKN